MSNHITKKFEYMKVDREALRLMEEFRQKFKELAFFIDESIEDSREKSLGLTKLEESAMWLQKAISHNSGEQQ